MKEYIKKFANASTGDNYSIAYIPFITSVETSGQNLVCNKTGKHLKNDNDTLIIYPPDTEPEMVDLGLSVKWAANNVGANPGSSKESYYGGYYAWGETETKTDYSWGTYKHGSSTKLTKYCPTDKTEYWGGEDSPDNKLVLEVTDDIVTQSKESYYHMPTKEELNELIALPNQWVTNYNNISGLNGRVFTGTNGNTLFIPAGGYFYGSTLHNTGSNCYLWSSSLYSNYPSNAWYLYFGLDNISVNVDYRCNGFPVRAVKA